MGASDSPSVKMPILTWHRWLGQKISLGFLHMMKWKDIGIKKVKWTDTSLGLCLVKWLTVVALWGASWKEKERDESERGTGRENSFPPPPLTIALLSPSKEQMPRFSRWHLQRENQGRNKSPSQFMRKVNFFFFSFFSYFLLFQCKKARRENHWQLLKWRRFSLFFPRWRGIFIHWTSRMHSCATWRGERESKPVHVKLPRQQNCTKKVSVSQCSKPPPMYSLFFCDKIPL